ncbi:MAG: hypothetical protein LBE79_12685 [Tannerella sp.]|jgi:hypothetical protein|nr:hypothetical protein [Tannerella sp.]
MRKQILFLSTAMFCALSIFAQTPFDSFAPEQSVKRMIELPQTQFKITNTNPDSEIRYVEFDRQAMSLTLFDENENVIQTLVFNPNEKKWNAMDPHAHHYYSTSPYAFCLNNPIRFIDPDGRDVWEINQQGKITWIEEHNQTVFQVIDANRQRIEGQSITFDNIVVESHRNIAINSTQSYDVIRVRGDANATNLFEFFSNNITGSPTQVEFSHAMTGVAGDRGRNYITTSHEARRESGMSHLLQGQLFNGYTIRELNHSHPVTAGPGDSDLRFTDWVTGRLQNQGLTIPCFNIYHVPTRQKIPFSR